MEYCITVIGTVAIQQNIQNKENIGTHSKESKRYLLILSVALDVVGRDTFSNWLFPKNPKYTKQLIYHERRKKQIQKKEGKYRKC